MKSVELFSLGDFPPGLLTLIGAVGLGAITLQTWLSLREPVWLGAIVPVCYLVFIVSFALVQPPTPGLIVGYSLTFLALFVLWWVGDYVRQRRRARSG